MGYEQLVTLAESYPRQEREALHALAQEYRSRDERQILDVAALAAYVPLVRIANLGLEPDADPQLLDAFRLQYPNVSPESLEGSSEERLSGLANGVKGKYFEVLVRDRLNAGERLGELQLEPGQVARLAESPTQSGWDLRIENADGSVAEEIQLKATESWTYVKEALEKYPDIRVATPSEIDGAAEEVLGTNISNQQLESVTQEQLGVLSEGTAQDLLDTGAEAALDSIPFVAIAITGVMEGRNLLMGRSTFRESLHRGTKRIGKATVYDSIGTLLGTTGVAIPAVIGLRMAEARVSGRISLGDHLESKTEDLRRLATEKHPINRVSGILDGTVDIDEYIEEIRGRSG